MSCLTLLKAPSICSVCSSGVHFLITSHSGQANLANLGIQILGGSADPKNSLISWQFTGWGILRIVTFLASDSHLLPPH